MDVLPLTSMDFGSDLALNEQKISHDKEFSLLKSHPMEDAELTMRETSSASETILLYYRVREATPLLRLKLSFYHKHVAPFKAPPQKTPATLNITKLNCTSAPHLSYFVKFNAKSYQLEMAPDLPLCRCSYYLFWGPPVFSSGISPWWATGSSLDRESNGFPWFLLLYFRAVLECLIPNRFHLSLATPHIPSKACLLLPLQLPLSSDLVSPMTPPPEAQLFWITEEQLCWSTGAREEGRKKTLVLLSLLHPANPTFETFIHST